MLRNDYRRSLILLRSNVSGYAGHVRLERRTLMGSMYFVVQSPDDCGELQAVLIGRGRSGYYACALGELRRDNRQQFSVSISFDPRNICSRELEEYQLAAVVRVFGRDCRIVLFGNLNGYAEIDWERATEAACMLFAETPPVTGIPVPPGPNRPAAPDTPILPTPSLPGGEQPAEPDTPILPTPSLPGGEQPAAPDTPILPTPSLPGGEQPAAPDTPILPTPSLPGGIQPQGDETAAAFFSTARPAAELLDADMSLPWPASVEGLKENFRISPALEIAPDDRYIYISVPMPAQSGYDSCAVGLRSENGRIAGVSYALPSLYSAEPPAGLEEYTWAGDNSRGWWVREVEVTE